jgi:hypothetical protein
MKDSVLKLILYTLIILQELHYYEWERNSVLYFLAFSVLFSGSMVGDSDIFEAM